MVTTHSLTYQDYANLEGDERHELLDGELIPVTSPDEDHQTASLRMIVRMNAFVNENDLGRVFHAPYDVLFTDTDVVQPDLLFVSKERCHIRTPANIQGSPDLAVEILSPSSSRRDWHDKRELYALHGVREYWTVDPTHRIVSILQLRDGVLEITQTCTEERCGRLRGPRGLQRQPGGAFRGVTIPCGSRRDRLGVSPARGIPSARGAGAPPGFEVRRGRPGVVDATVGLAHRRSRTRQHLEADSKPVAATAMIESEHSRRSP